MSRPETALGILRNRANEVNELATAYNTIVGYIERLEAAESQLKGDLDTLTEENEKLRDVLAKVNEDYRRLAVEDGKLQTYCDALENRFMAPDGKTIDNVTVGNFKRLMHDILKEYDEHLEPLVRPMADSIPPVATNRDNDGQSDSRTAAKEQAA